MHLPHLDKHKMYLRTQHAAHMMYFAMVFLEGHSMYAYTAGFLFLSTAVGVLLHEGDV